MNIKTMPKKLKSVLHNLLILGSLLFAVILFYAIFDPFIFDCFYGIPALGSFTENPSAHRILLSAMNLIGPSVAFSLLAFLLRLLNWCKYRHWFIIGSFFYILFLSGILVPYQPVPDWYLHYRVAFIFAPHFVAPAFGILTANWVLSKKGKILPVLAGGLFCVLLSLSIPIADWIIQWQLLPDPYSTPGNTAMKQAD